MAFLPSCSIQGYEEEEKKKKNQEKKWLEGPSLNCESKAAKLTLDIFLEPLYPHLAKKKKIPLGPDVPSTLLENSIPFQMF